MNISIIISVIALALSISTFFYNNKISEINRTIDAFSKLRVEALDKMDELTIEDIEDAYSNESSNNVASKSEIKCCMARIDNFCLLVLNGVYDYKLFKKINNGYINGVESIKKYKQILKLMRSKNRGYYKNLEEMIRKLNGTSFTWNEK